MDELSYCIFLNAKPYPAETSLRIRTRPLATTFPTSLALALALERQRNNAWKWHMYTVFICCLTIDVLSIFHRRTYHNHEPLISLRAPKQCFLNAAAMLRRNFIPVITAPHFMSPTLPLTAFLEFYSSTLLDRPNGPPKPG
jgi:hypothetical protein